MAHPKTGGYLPVPNVQALAQTWNGSGEVVPDRYVRTEDAAAEEVVAGCVLPVVDLGRLLDARSSQEELANLGSACQHWGYFQLINHGVPEEVIQDVRRDIAEFFKLPLQAKKAYAQVSDDIQGYGQGFVFSETQKLDWADMIYLKLRPMESRNMRFWPAQPPSFRKEEEPNHPMAHENAGGHLDVPNVQALAQTWNGSGEHVPARYVRTEEAGGEVVVAGHALPVVDLGRLLDPRSSEEELANLSSACQQGVFELINHGVPDEVIQEVKRDIAEFFKLPLEAKKVHAKPPDGLEGYGQVFVFSDTQKLDWSDMLYLMLRPAESRDIRFWPVQLPSFRSSVDRYSSETAKVVSCLLRFMADDMGVDPERLLEMFGGQPQTIKMTYYPPCRQADKVLGLSPHTDACAMTVLLHVNDVQGLQIKKDGKWLAVEPLAGALIVSVGDIIEILSNGKYKSIEHRAVVNPDKERIAAAMFHQPRNSITVEPLPELVKKDDGGARYKSVGYAEFMRQFFSAKLDGRSHLDHFRID